MATIDVSDELLRLLTAINEKLDSGRRLERRESVAANEVLAEQQNLTPNGRWGDNTLAGWFLNSDVHLRPPSSKGIFETNPIRELIEHNEEESDILRSWGLKYESPFRTHLIEARDIAEEICKIPRDLWAIPSDGRIFLALTPRSLSLGKRPRADLLESLTRLREFDADLRSRKGCGFSVLDYDPWARKYLAHGALKDDFESELFMTDFVTREICWDDQNPEPGPQSRDRGGIFAPLAMKRFLSVDIQRTAPWRRIIILCGLGTMPPTSPNSSSTGSGHRYFEQPVPNSNGVIYDLWQQEAPNLLIEEHLNCSRTSAKGSENPFLRPRGFQLVFFEILDDPKPARETIWKMGELFEDNTGGTNKLRKRLFRRSAFSAYVCLPPSSYSYGDRFSPLYTVLLLLPNNFVKRSGTISSHPTFKRLYIPDIIDMSRAPTGFEAELNCVVLGLSQVTARWTELNDYLSTLIVQDFMEPKKYWRFLFDDENFTLSKRYFWAIGCLAEFIGYIKDNNQQWDWFYEARIEPLLREENLADRLDAATLDENDLPDLDDSTYTAAKIKEERLKKFQNLVNEGKKSRDALANLQTQFENKLDTFKTLRDGLFNASALIESRASTRLGQNVKLLTYVSIFYLPLAFCAALWAIPNIQDKATKIPFVITAILVGVVTYAIVFNMDFITNKAKSWYFPRRENVVAEMRKEEQSELWRGVGQKFEQLQPQSKSQVPTEWWIPTFVTLQVFKRGAWTWKQPSEKNQLVNQAKGETGKSSDASPERGSTSAAHNADGEKEVKSSRLMFWRGKKSHDPHV